MISKRTIKRLLFVTMISILAIQVTACGSKKTKEDKLESVVKIQDDILAAGKKLPDMTTVNSDTENAKDLFAYLSEVDYSKIDSYFLSYSSEGLADEVAVVRVKDKTDVRKVKKTIEKHIAGRVSFYESYDPTQVDRAKGAVIFTEGNDVVLIVSDDAAAIKKEYKEKVK